MAERSADGQRVTSMDEMAMESRRKSQQQSMKRVRMTHTEYLSSVNHVVIS